MWWPDYAGNNMFNSFGNLAVDPTAALLFVDFPSGRTLQLSGTATIDWEDAAALGKTGDLGKDSHTGRRAHFRTHRVASGHLTRYLHRQVKPIMTDTLPDNSNGATRVKYLLGAPLSENAVRQWPQMRKVVRDRQLIADVEGSFPELTLEVGRRHQLGNTIVVEWTCNYGDGRLYRNVTIGELVNSEVVTVTRLLGCTRRHPPVAARHDRRTRHARRRYLERQRPPHPALATRQAPAATHQRLDPRKGTLHSSHA